MLGFKELSWLAWYTDLTENLPLVSLTLGVGSGRAGWVWGDFINLPE